MARFAGSLTLPTAAIIAAGCLALGGCREDAGPISASVAPVKIKGETFFLEIAATPEARFNGLSHRTHIEPDGGMIFVFPPSEIRPQSFVMRDCPNPIDILYLDRAGRVMTTYTMAPEPRQEDERVLTAPFDGAPAWTHTNSKYENRLTKYPSRYPSHFVIELRGGRIKELGVEEGDLIEFDAAGLKKQAR